MSFLSVLKAVGKGALSIAGLVNTPLVRAGEALLPQSVQPFVSEFNKIAAEVGVVERIGENIKAQLGNASAQGGAVNVSLAKAAAVLPSVKDIILEASFMSGRKIANADRFNAGCQKILDGMVDVLDSVEHPNG